MDFHLPDNLMYSINISLCPRYLNLRNNSVQLLLLRNRETQAMCSDMPQLGRDVNDWSQITCHARCELLDMTRTRVSDKKETEVCVSLRLEWCGCEVRGWRVVGRWLVRVFKYLVLGRGLFARLQREHLHLLLEGELLRHGRGGRSRLRLG